MRLSGRVSTIAQSIMSRPQVIIPSSLESHLCTDSGQQGADVRRALSMEEPSVGNLYSFDAELGQLKYAFKENGVAYNEKETSGLLCEATLDLKDSASVSFTLEFEEGAVQRWGISFCGVVRVRHASGEVREVYLPGTRTYDPAGLTGDPHASERIGPSCARAQTGITVAELYAAKQGATLEQISTLQEASRAAILRYHGRDCLFEWMRQQLEDAIFKNKDVTPYPEFVKVWVESGKLSLSDARSHTKEYLTSYAEGHAVPPLLYYKKVAAKDDVSKILSEEDQKEFQKLIQ